MSAIIDHASLLVAATADATLAEIERALADAGLTLDVNEAAHALTVREWIERGTPGARDVLRDPVDQIVAGFEATLRDGRALAIRPAPRRAVGPDLFALLAGAGGRFATLTKAWLRVHRRDAERPESPPFAWPRDPPVSAEESALLDAISAELSRAR